MDHTREYRGGVSRFFGTVQRDIAGDASADGTDTKYADGNVRRGKRARSPDEDVGQLDVFGYRAFAIRWLALQPEQYWRLTLVELHEMIQGAIWREGRQWERNAWIVAHLVNISGKSIKGKVTADSLLGKQKKVQDPHVDFNEFWQRVEKQRAKEEAS